VAALADLPTSPDEHPIRVPEQRQVPLERLVFADETFWRGAIS
jgi:hypothetical protein